MVNNIQKENTSPFENILKKLSLKINFEASQVKTLHELKCQFSFTNPIDLLSETD